MSLCHLNNFSFFNMNGILCDSVAIVQITINLRYFERAFLIIIPVSCQIWWLVRENLIQYSTVTLLCSEYTLFSFFVMTNSTLDADGVNNAYRLLHFITLVLEKFHVKYL